MKKKIYTSLIFSLVVILAFSQTRHRIFFKPLGKDQSWTVPAGVTQIKVKLWGAGGAGGGDIMPDCGGGGGFASAVLKVIPGESLTIIVGAGGLPGKGPGAYGGGGAKACGKSGRGGGRSAIRDETGMELITAGGGGGGGESPYPGPYPTVARGGGGGGLQGNPNTWVPFNGWPGTQTAGGVGGNNTNGCSCGSNQGSQFKGADADCVDNGFNGSGGGGYYGGGSGTDYGDGGGGGGSSYVPGNGKTISASLTDSTPGNTTDPDYRNPIGYGGPRTKAGECGLVVIIYTDNSNIADPENNSQFITRSTVYPNPAMNTVNINFTAQQSGKYIFEVSGINGNILLRKETNALQGVNHITLDISSFFKGSYFINIISPDKTTERIQLNKE
jgi:hypothetical protein